LAAKHPSKDPGLSPDINNGVDYRGKVAYDMDMGTPDKVFTCASCHSGGIMAFDRDSGKRHDEVESWDNQTDGKGFFSSANYTDSEVDGDYFSYTADEESRGYIGMPTSSTGKSREF
jgi:outer membrane protein assembly factor BamB